MCKLAYLPTDLPAPRSNTGVVIQEEDELEDEVKPKPSEIENAQKPPDKKKQPVKIILPSLDKVLTHQDFVPNHRIFSVTVSLSVLEFKTQYHQIFCP